MPEIEAVRQESERERERERESYLCRKMFATVGWLFLVCCNIYSLFTQNRSFVTLYIVNDET